MEVRLGGADTDHEQQVCTPAHSYELISADKSIQHTVRFQNMQIWKAFFLFSVCF